jgi:hypothetical protein
MGSREGRGAVFVSKPRGNDIPEKENDWKDEGDRARTI